MRQYKGAIVTNYYRCQRDGGIFEKHFAEYGLINTFASPIGD